MKSLSFPVLLTAAVLVTAPLACAQADPSFNPTTVSITGFRQTQTITITSPYNDCTMTITASTSDPTIATIAPPGPVQGIGPFTFTITSGLKAGSATIIFYISGDPGGCVLSPEYDIPLTVRDVLPTPQTSVEEKEVIEPISMANGAFLNSYLDLRLRGPLPIYFERYYYSALAAEVQVKSALGTNWMNNYDITLTAGATSASVIYYQGQTILFTNTSGTWTQTTSDPFRYQLQQSGTTFHMLDPFSHLIYTFNGANGQLQSVQDRNGNSIAFTYSNGLLSHVADGLGATLDFTYSGSNLTKVVDQTGRSIAFAYTQNLLTSFTDATGKTTSYAYAPGGGLMTEYTLPRGNVPYTQTYDTSQRVATQNDAAANTFSFSFNSASGQSTMTNPLSQVSTYVHAARNLVQETDPAGNVSKIAYDANNRPTSHRDLAGNTTTFSYQQAAGLIASTTNPDGGTVSYTYVSSTNSGFTFYDLSLVTYPDGTTESFQYDQNGNVTGRTNRMGQQWKSTYNSKGQPLVVTAPDGTQTTITYSQDGSSAPASVQYPDGLVITLKLDGLKRLVSRKRSDGSAFSFTYDAYDRPLTYTNEVGAVTTFAYDANGLLASVTDQDGGTIKISRTGTDKIGAVTDAAGRALTIRYDAVDRSAGLTWSDGTANQIAYDAAGNPASYTDGEGKVWKQVVDATGAETSLTTPLGAQTSFTLDSMDRQVSLTSPAGKTAAFAYDKMDRLTSVTDPLQHPTVYSYDKNGRIIGVAIPGGIAAAYARDPLGQVTGITDPNGNVWSIKHDPFGRLLSLADPLGQATTYKRDAQGRVSQVVLPLGTMTATVDAAGRLTHGAYSDNTAFDFAWDPADRLTSATGLAFQYDASGAMSSSNGLAIVRDKLSRVTQVTLAPGKTITYTYDRRGLVTQVSDWVGGATVMKYDDASHLISITRPNGVTTTYSYDADGDVVSVQEAGAAPLSSISLTRDQRGLVTQANRNVPLSPTPSQLASSQSFHTYDAADRIAEFKYDAMGRRVSDDNATYTWDLASHLTGYMAGGGSAGFTYNALEMIASQVTGGITFQYVWNFALDLPSISVVRTASGDVTYYVHTPGGQLLHSIDATGKRSFYHFDEMGNTIFLTDDSGAISDKYAYTEYGALIAPGGGSSNLFLYQGRYGAMYLGAGLYAMRQRVYDSRTAAFLSRDPRVLLAPRLMNPYEYAAGNSLRFRDVTGNEASSSDSGSVCTVSNGLDAASGVTGTASLGAETAGLGNATEAGNNLQDFVNNMGVTEGAPNEQAEIQQLWKYAKKANQLKKAGKCVDAVGKAGLAVQLVQVGMEAHSFNSALQQVNSEYYTISDANLAAYRGLFSSILDLYRSGKIGAVQKNNMMLAAKINYEDAQMVTQELHMTDFILQSHVFFKNSMGTFVPVPLRWLGLTPENKLNGEAPVK
jgi:RHS repeat-associated protein